MNDVIEPPDRFEGPQERARLACLEFDEGRGNIDEAMSLLAESFHALERRVPGVRPWNPNKLAKWVREGRATTHELSCGVFILNVYNPNGSCRTFKMMDALRGWDRSHQAAFAGWAQNPWWPSH